MPNIAFGDLAQSSLAEVLAAGFRTYATGTVAVEQGRGESRLFMRYGLPCGTQLYVGARSFADYLIEQGAVDDEKLERYVKKAAEQQRKLGELLVAAGALSEERVLELVTAHHATALGSLCLLREGKYELRGWERPPEWTEPVALDPLQAILRALAVDELFDRRAAILEQLGDQKLTLAGDFTDQAARLMLAPADQAALAQLRTPRKVVGLVRTLPREDTEAFIAAVALLGLIDVAPSEASVSVPAGSPGEGVLEDASHLLRPAQPTLPPPAAGGFQLLDGGIEEEVVIEDTSSLLTPLGQSQPPPKTTKGSAQRSAPAAAPPELTPSELSEVGLGPPETFAVTGSGLGHDLELNGSTEEEPLELDLQRAPRDMRERLGTEMLSRPKPKVQPQRPAPSAPPPPRSAAAAPSSKHISWIEQKPAQARAPEYNPFAVHFRKPAAEFSFDPAPAPVRPPRPAAVPTPPPPKSRPRIGTESSPEQILADIADLVGDLEETSTPLTLEQPPLRVSSGDDELALLAATETAEKEVTGSQDVEVVESAEELSGEHSVPAAVLTEAADAPSEPAMAEVDVPIDTDLSEEGAQEVTPPKTVAPEPSAPVATEASGRHSAPHPTASADGSERTPSTPDEVRRKLRLRAFRNIAGGLMAREPTSRTGVTRADTPAARPALADAELEKDVADRLTKLVSQDHFARLGLEQNASTEQVKEAFLSLAKRYHPDRITALGQNHLLPQVRELFARIKESYDVLVDPASRARYVAELNDKEGARNKPTPEEAKVSYQRSQVFLRKRDLTNAEAELVRAVAGDPKADYLAELAWTLQQNPNRRDDAKGEIRDLITRALKSGTETDRTYLLAAYIARADGDAEKAERYFRKALEKNPLNKDAGREIWLIDKRASEKKPSGGFFDRLRSKPSSAGK